MLYSTNPKTVIKDSIDESSFNTLSSNLLRPFDLWEERAQLASNEGDALEVDTPVY